MQDLSPTVRDAINFLREYGHQETIKEWNDQDFCNAIFGENKTLAWSRDRSNQLTGVVLATITGDVVHIDTIALRGEPLRTFIAKFEREYPGYKLTGNRKGKLKHFYRYGKSSRKL